MTRTILEDVADRPGTLPLVEHLLLELWRRRRGSTLTLEAYAASGGVEGALASRANDVMAGLPDEQRDVARRVLLRLIQPGEGTEDTRRRAPIRELARSDDERPDVEAVVVALASERLLTTDRDPGTGEPVVDVAHEALIRGWPELRAWIDEDREGLRLHRQLTEVTGEWERGGRDDETLYRGARLTAWDERDVSELNDAERAFLMASRERVERDRRSGRRRVQYALAGLGVAVLVVSGIAAFAFVQRGNADDQRDVARSRQLAANARLQLPTDPELAILLARGAYETDPTAEAEEALRQSVHESSLRQAHRTHSGPVNDVEVSADGQTYASAGDDGTVRIWRPSSGQEPAALSGHEGPVTGVDLDPSGTTIFSSGSDGTVRRWTVNGRQLRVYRAPPEGVNEVAVSPDGKSFATAGNDGVIRVTSVGGRALATLEGHQGPVGDVAFDPSGDRIASGGFDQTVRIWPVSGGKPIVLSGHAGPVFGVTFSPDGRRVLSSSADFTARIWSLDTGNPRPRVLRAAQVFGVNDASYSRDGRFIVTAGLDATVRVWNGEGQLQVVLRGHQGGVRQAHFSPDGQMVVSAGSDGSVRLWAWRQTTPAVVLPPFRDFPSDGGATFAPDGSTILSVGLEGSVRRWNPSTGSTALIAEGGPPDQFVNTGAVTADASRLVVTRPGGDVVVSDLSARGGTRTFKGHQGDVFAAAFSPDGGRLATGGTDGTVRVWDVASGRGQVIATLEGPVNVVRFSRDGARLVAGGEDATARVWDVATRSLIGELKGHTGPVTDAAFDPSGRTVVTGGFDRTVRVWDIVSGKGNVLEGHQNSVFTSAFSTDGQRILSSADDGVRVWDAGTLRTVFTVAAPERDTYRAAMSPDGRRIAVQTFDARILIYDCDTCGTIDEVTDLADQRVTRDLGAQEVARLGN